MANRNSRSITIHTGIVTAWGREIFFILSHCVGGLKAFRKVYTAYYVLLVGYNFPRRTDEAHSQIDVQWITFSGTFLSNSWVATVPLRLWFVKWPLMPASQHIIFKILANEGPIPSARVDNIQAVTPSWPGAEWRLILLSCITISSGVQSMASKSSQVLFSRRETEVETGLKQLAKARSACLHCHSCCWQWWNR